MSNDVLYPLLIGGACLIAVYLVHLLTRPKPTRADITLPEGIPLGPNSTSPTADGVTASALVDWHRSNEAALLDYFEFHDALLASSIKPDENRARAVSSAFEESYATHPAPDMRAELAATRAAADAMTSAKERDDLDAIVRHHGIYVRYRDAWLERLWQFAKDHQRITRLRQNDLLA